MASISAAELQKRHGLEGAPDPFPTAGSGAIASSKATNGSAQPVDTNSDEAFPALGGPAPAAAAPKASMWSSASSKVKARAPAHSAPGGAGRSGAPSSSALPASTSFSLPSANINLTPKAFSDLTKKIHEQYGVTVEASTQMRTGLKTFFLRGPDDKKVANAKKQIERGVSKIETITVDVPLSTLGSIIGPKGSTLKTITDATGVKIDIPRRDTLPSVPARVSSDDGAESDDEEPEDPVVSISLNGPTPALADAKSRILALIQDKVSQTSIKIKDIPSDFYPFISGPKGSKAKELESTLGEGKVQIHIPPPSVWRALEKQADAAELSGDAEEDTTDRKRDLSIRVKGDREIVAKVIDEIRRQYEDVRDNSSTLNISIPKRQHRFLVGASADEILEKHQCIVDLPPVEDSSDNCTIRGPKEGLVQALSMVMEKANAISVETVDLVAQHRSATADPLAHAKAILRYLLRTSTLRQIADSVSGVKVYPPFQAAVDAAGTVVIEIVGEDKKQVLQAKEDVLAAVKAITPAHIKAVEIDFAVHRFLIGKKGAKINQFESQHNVRAVFPPPSEESSIVFLVLTGDDSALPKDKKQRDAQLSGSLTKAAAAISDLAKEAADVKTETIDVDQKWHRHVIGPGGSVLRALLGEDQLATVTVGNKDAQAAQDVIVVRGPSTEVDRVVPAIKQIVEDAKNDDLVNGFTQTFNVEKRHVPHLVGSSGSAINKLRESLSVRINFDDDESANKKSAKNALVSCKIIGRKEAVEEAKKRLLAQVERLDDETTEILNIKRALHAALIGSSGKYAIRLEEKYAVKITFPRDGKDGEDSKSSLKPDEVQVRGGKKGVAAAKAELLEAAEFEKESNQSSSFTVPTSAVAKILGKGGNTINSIKDETGAQIDVDKTSEAETTITVKGDKKAIAAAKSTIQSIASEVADRADDSLTIEPKYHRALIGPGGQKLRDLVIKAGGSEEQSRQAGLINFPRAGDASPDLVRLRGERDIVQKIKAELERTVEELRNQVVLGVAVPAAQHAIKIGRGGSALQDIQKKTGAIVQFPGSRQYGSAGEPENMADLTEVPANELVKVIGTRSACDQAIEILSTTSEVPSRSRTPVGRSGNFQGSSKTVSVPAKYFYALTEHGQLTRQLRQAGVQFDLPSNPPAKPEARQPSAPASAPGAATARIDEDDQDNLDSAINYAYEEYDAFEGYPDEDLEFVLRGREEVVERGEKILQSLIAKVAEATKVGILVGIPRSAFPRIIGSKGATIARLRAETGAEIQVGKEDDLITLTGDSEAVGFAKDAIISIASRSGQRF